MKGMRLLTAGAAASRLQAIEEAIVNQWDLKGKVVSIREIFEPLSNVNAVARRFQDPALPELLAAGPISGS